MMNSVTENSRDKSLSIAVAIPCFNEQVTIGKVIRDFQAALPEARIYVFDNDSSDASARLAADAGAVICQVHRRGKGRVMRAV